MQKLSDLAAEKDAVIVVGTHKEIDENSRHNTALTLNKGGVLGEHHKNHTVHFFDDGVAGTCLLYTSPSPRDLSTSRMPSSA